MDRLHQPYTHEDYTIGWVCARPNEQEAATFMLDERHGDLGNPPNDSNVYTLGSIGKHKIVIAGLPMGRYGTSSAAEVATRMLSTFPNIRVSLLVGIGGGIPQKTRLGDVVVGCPSGTDPGVVQWDMRKAMADSSKGSFIRTGSLAPPPSPLLTALARLQADPETRANILTYLKDLESIPNIPRSFFKSDSLQDILYESTYNHAKGPGNGWFDDILGRDDCLYCDKSRIVQRKERENDLMIHYGLIATANQLIKDAITRDELYKNFNNNVLCFEMEVAGLMNDYPCLVIRGICDYSDSHRNREWQNYAAATAAACAKALLKKLPSSDIDKLHPARTLLPPMMGDAKRLWPFWRDSEKGRSDVPGG
ncbi:nucleoside phosphorylase domain-containing protein [Trichoderma pleuroticola]